MINLIKMDLYRMFKARSFKVCLLLALLLSFSQMPLLKVVSMLLSLIPGAGSISGMIPKSANLSSLIGNPFPGINFILMMFSACYFFYADLEHGFIKNIAGQMPKKGYTVLSKYLAAIVHNLIFIAAGIIGNLIGHLLIVKLIMDKDVMKMTGAMCVRFLLVMALTAILLLVVASVHSKTFGMVLAVVFGADVLNLLYLGIDAAVLMAFKKSISIENYMPDQLMWQSNPKLPLALPVAAVTILVFLLLAIRIFDRRDVK